MRPPRRPPLLLALGALAGGAVLPAVAVAEAPPSLLTRLDQQSKGVRSLAGEFTQKNKIKLFKQELRSQGRFFFERPRRIRWEYKSPDPSTLILDGTKATLRAPGAPLTTFDLQRDPVMRTIFDQLLLWLGSGSLAGAGGDYEIVEGGTAAAPQLTLTPRAASPIAKAFTSIELGFDRELLLRRILLREPGGDEKLIELPKLEKNGKLPGDAFQP